MNKTVLAILMVSVAAFAAPASANYFSNPTASATLNIGSAPNPKPFVYAPFTEVREQSETIPAPPPPPLAEVVPPPAPEYVKTFMVFFDFDKSNLTAEARQVVAEAVRIAKLTGPVRIVVTGHTDTVGSHAYNQGLSERRAMSVKTAMVQMGLDGAMIATVGRSFDDPLVATGPGIREPQNRRAVIDLSNPPVASLQ